MVAHYKGFIEVASCLRALRAEVAAVSEHVAALQLEVPALGEACAGFTAYSKEHATKRSRNKQLLSELTDILDCRQGPESVHMHANHCKSGV